MLSNRHVATQVIKYIAGTNSIFSSILDYLNSTASISYSKSYPTFIIVFKSNIYVDLKSISIINKETNVREYKIDLIDHDRTILQTVNIDTQQKQPTINFHAPISALQITYLTTIDDKAPRNIRLSIDGCFGFNPSPSTTESAQTVLTTPQPPLLTTCAYNIYSSSLLIYKFCSLLMKQHK